ncbi:hypothetical protein FQA39_LY02973 [Lamprigera yunnana]|nr:hypothetical protein FQA39_LY02973 [Lamprigera yunnana]
MVRSTSPNEEYQDLAKQFNVSAPICIVLEKYSTGILWTSIKVYDCCDSTPGCNYFLNGSTYSCSGMLWIETKPPNARVELNTNTRILEICNLEREVLNLHKITIEFPYLTNITVWQGNVSTIAGTFSPNNRIKVLQLRNLLVRSLPSKSFNFLKNLEVLDLSGNHLQSLDNRTVLEINRVPKTNLSSNHWNCSLDLEWALNLNKSIVNNLTDFTCYQSPYAGKPVIAIAHIKKDVHDSCPKKCECSLPDVVTDPSNLELEPIIEVNCSKRNFSDFPLTLPKKTKILLLDKNNLNNLSALILNHIYKDVQDVNLDNNFIDNIDGLEGSYWFQHFRVLSLRNNLVTQLPTYALDNALQQNPNMPAAVRVYFGGNPWKCDCAFIPSFQELLRKYEDQIIDTEDVRCSYIEGDENSYAMILDLSRSSLCRLPSDYSVHTLDLVNGILASLIIFILGKLAYDYYHFKRTGQLPWIVTKIP